MPLLLLLIMPLGGCSGYSSGAHTTPAAPVSPGTPVNPTTPDAPKISSFAANPPSINSGQSVTLTWQTSGATSLQINNVTATLASSSSSMVVAPAATTTYTLTATNSAGSTQQSATVTVSALPTIAEVQIDPAATAQPISPNFLGLGHVMGDVLSMIGTSASNMNPIYEQLLKNLTQYANAPILIRELTEGSDPADLFAAPRLAALSQLNADVGAQYMVGIDFLDDDVSTATTETQQLVDGLPKKAFKGIEVGNEPDLYGANGERPADWDYTQYLADYQKFAPAVLAASGGVKLEAPVWAGLTPGFMNNLNSFVAAQASQLAFVTVHHYPGGVCNGATEPADYLLTEAAVDGDTQPLTGPVEISQYMTAAQAAGIPFRIGELNSISCGGQLGVTNSFSSALWAMDISFAYAKVGVSGVNFFAPGDPYTVNPYAPFDFNSTIGQGGVRTYAVRDINPLYYGLLLFAQAVQNKAQLLPVALTTQGNIKTWATIDANRTIRVLLLNKDEAASGPVSISLNGYGAASVTRLTAPSYSSTTGVMLGGQTFDGSADGTPQGAAYSESNAAESGVYTVTLPAVSAALVTIQP
ncbi:MAG: glycosyl hydrolase family 79 C-terminal domain-containing protein [Candidatus Sulfotelmatobacter sp.]|jgi:hypothetical protein